MESSGLRLVGCESSGVSSSITYPTNSQKARDDLSGRYNKGLVSWELVRQSGLFHAVVVEFTSEKNGHDWGRLESISSLEEGKLVVTTALDSCKFVLEPQEKSIKVLSTKGCGKLGLHLSGVFSRKEAANPLNELRPLIL